MDVNKDALNKILSRLDLADKNLVKYNSWVSTGGSPVPRLEPEETWVQTQTKETIDQEKASCLKYINRELENSNLTPEAKTSISAECKRVVEPNNTNIISKNVEKFKTEQPKLNGTPEQNKASIENWAKQLNSPVKEQEKEVPQSKPYEPPRLAPPITEKFNDKADKPPSKKKIDIERGI
jgi:hypothetical protein